MKKLMPLAQALIRGIFVWFALLLTTTPALAQSFKTRAEIDFPNAIIFYLEAEAPQEINKVVLRYQIERKTLFKEIVDRHPSFEPGKKIKTSFREDLIKIGGLPPGAEIKYFWIIKDSEGNRWTSQPQIVEFVDPRFSWKKLSQNNLTFFWYAGSEEFIQELLASAEKARLRLEKLLGIKLDEVKFYLYDDAHDMQRARIFPREWEGGVAFPDYGTVILAIQPGNLSWGKRTIAHELSHLGVFEATLGGFSPPTWLNEGLAMYMEGEPSSGMKSILNKAIKEDRLISVRSLASSFPAGREEALLAYAQSFSLVEFLVKIGGEEKISALFKALREGKGYEEALFEIYGWDIPTLERAWRQSSGLPPEPERAADPEIGYWLISALWLGLALISRRRLLFKLLRRSYA